MQLIESIEMISFTYNMAFLLGVLIFTIFRCSALTSCGTFSELTATFFLCDGQNITSAGDIKFQLGFFSPKGNSNKNRYVGIWYLTNPETVVWVANRDNPLQQTSNGSFGIRNEGDGNLQLFDEKGNSYFSTNLEPTQSKLTTARLLEGGNLVLSDKQSGKILWQSFDKPTDTFLPGMKMSKDMQLISWTSSQDPSRGNYRFENGEKEGAVNSGYVIIRNETMPYWKSGGQSKNFTSNNKLLGLALLDNFFNSTKGRSPTENTTALINPYFNMTRLVITWSGEIQYLRLDTNKNIWSKIWWEPQNNCSIYNACGRFGTCRMEYVGICDCLPGFKPTVLEKWESGDHSGGCTRKTNLCEEEEKYMFSMLNVTKVDDADYYFEADEEMCKLKCLNNCRCQTYSYRFEEMKTGESPRNSCYMWTTDLADIEVANTKGAPTLFVKVATSTIGLSTATQNEPNGTHPRDESRENSLSSDVVIIIIVCSVIIGVLLQCSIICIYYRWRVDKRKENRTDMQRHIVTGPHSRHLSEEEKGSIDVPFFDLESILVATDYFSDANKLGEGGFGPVYKGTFSGGREIAVKRLAVHSVQGIEELKNEVVLIAKLQHRNLVRLLGYCIEEDENILLYEYMKNKSLDAFIFDKNLCIILDWEKRFEIILGIARGLLYLHHDSRLRIIHRDLKASNILLDDDMNPKISDFGLARIVGGGDTQANTNRIMGTYGYMSPEYALDGLFSIKSDVFSYGVVVLEIISGKKNTGFYKSQYDLNLLGYAWRLWKEGNTLGIMDKTIAECCNKNEVLKCITIALLCIQEDPSDRPDMSNIVLMLGNTYIGDLRSPKRPAFVARTDNNILSNKELTLSHQQILSNNDLTLSLVKPR